MDEFGYRIKYGYKGQTLVLEDERLFRCTEDYLPQTIISSSMRLHMELYGFFLDDPDQKWFLVQAHQVKGRLEQIAHDSTLEENRGQEQRT